MTRGTSVHEIAQCRDCSWGSEARNAIRLAAKHHDRTGHEVTGERGLYFSWPRKRKTLAAVEVRSK